MIRIEQIISMDMPKMGDNLRQHDKKRQNYSALYIYIYNKRVYNSTLYTRI